MIPAEDQIPRVELRGRPARDYPPRTEAIKDEGYEQVRDQFVPHVRDFLAAIRSRRQPVSDLASAQRTATACHLANVAHARRAGRAVGRRRPTTWSATPRRRALLTKAYRAPWDRELRAIVPTPC